ncbi:tetratricopeptide repeat protein [Candidatus Margulisiibacteriota bacterium]
MKVHYTPQRQRQLFRGKQEKEPDKEKSKAFEVKEEAVAQQKQDIQIADKINALLRKAVEEFSKGNLKGARSLLQQAHKMDPQNANILHNLGTVLNKMGLFQEALKFLGKALKLEPHNLVTINNLGFAYFNLKMYKKAILFFRQAAHIDPLNYTFLRHLGFSFFHEMLYEEALRYLKKALKIRPEDIEAQNLFKKASRLFKEKSIQELENFLKSQPDDTSATLLKHLTCPMTKKLFNNPILLPTGETIDFTEEVKGIIEEGKNPLHPEKRITLKDVIPNKHILHMMKDLFRTVQKRKGS